MNRSQRTKSGVAYACDQLIVRRGGTVHRIGRGRDEHVQSPALLDRRYHVLGHALWWAPRTSRISLSREVRQFCEYEYIAGNIAGAGDENDLRLVLGFLSSGKPSDARAVAWQFVLNGR